MIPYWRELWHLLQLLFISEWRRCFSCSCDVILIHCSCFAFTIWNDSIVLYNFSVSWVTPAQNALLSSPLLSGLGIMTSLKEQRQPEEMWRDSKDKEEQRIYSATQTSCFLSSDLGFFFWSNLIVAYSSHQCRHCHDCHLLIGWSLYFQFNPLRWKCNAVIFGISWCFSLSHCIIYIYIFFFFWISSFVPVCDCLIRWFSPKLLFVSAAQVSTWLVFSHFQRLFSAILALTIECLHPGNKIKEFLSGSNRGSRNFCQCRDRETMWSMSHNSSFCMRFNRTRFFCNYFIYFLGKRYCSSNLWSVDSSQ